ncbi:hypothetical protein GF324_07655 [bacterium]|nr:hypothetical protein [bacterium]
MNESTTATERALEALDYDNILAALADRTDTEYGRRRLLTLRPRPFGTWIDDEFDAIDQLLGALIRGEPLVFGGVRDIVKSLERSKAPGSYLDPSPLLDVAQTAEASRKLRESIDKRSDSLSAVLPFSDSLASMPKLEQGIRAKIDVNSAEVKDAASPELRRIRSKIASLANRSRSRLEAHVQKYGNLGWLLETGYTLRDGRYVLAVRSPYKNKIRGIIHGSSASGGTVYLEPEELVGIGNEMRELIEEEAEEIRRILIELTDLVREHHDELRWSIDAIGQIDSLQGRARFAEQTGAMRPRVGGDELRLVQARHPLLVLRKGLEDTVPLDLHLERERRALVITGPNAGGKTVALKTVGLTTALVHAGIWPPTGDGTMIPDMQAWHVVIGDDQSLEGDLSSFSGHLTRLREVTDDTSTSRLVLVDEIAAGTDPAEGAGLAMAFLDQGIEERWWTIITTHIGELKAYAHRRDGVRNGSMQFDREHLTPTYRFQPDLPGSSYALEIARRVGLPDKMLTRASDYVGEGKQRLEDLIEELAETMRRAEKQARELAMKQSEVEGLETVLRQRLESFEEKRSELQGKAAREAEEILREANRAVEHAVKKIRETQASRDAISEAHQSIEEQKRRISDLQQKTSPKKKTSRSDKKAGGAKRPSKPVKTDRKPEPEPEEILPGEVRVGDYVRSDSGVEGEVLAIQNKKAQVAAGSLKIWVRLDDLERIRKRKKSGSGVKVHVSRQDAPKEIPMELKLLGMRYEEAEPVLDKYLNDLSVSGLPFARIVHGKGTGALKSLVHKKLERHPHIRNWHLAGDNEGGAGVTIVELG